MAGAAMLADINVLFVPPLLDGLDPDVFTPGLSTADAIKALKLGNVEYVREYVAAMPPYIVDAMLGAIHAALTTDPRSTVTVAWMEDPVYGVKISRAAAALDTGRGAVNILLTGPATP